MVTVYFKKCTKCCIEKDHILFSKSKKGKFGVEFKTQMISIKNKDTVSCGCFAHIHRVDRNTTHNLSKHHLYKLWISICYRVESTREHEAKSYLFKGIKLCDEWKNSPESFFKWCELNGYKQGLSIDRIDNNGNYEPSNCRFVDRNIQCRNTRLLFSHNTSGYRGVCFDKSRQKWLSRIVIDNKSKTLGRFNSAIDAYVIAHNLEHPINNELLRDSV